MRFVALSAPGPSGGRPEHIQEALQAKSRTVTGKLLQSLGRFESKALAGALPSSMRWIARSRLVYLKKKDGDKPRPIRIGEVIKRIASKRAVRADRQTIETKMREMRQWGVGTPGGCEALVHFRNLVEHAATSGSIEPLVCLDTELENCFCTLEWENMRADLEQHLPSILPWVAWQQQETAAVVLPCGEEVRVDRGAEQGEPLGSAETAVMIGCASLEAHQEMAGDGPHRNLETQHLDQASGVVEQRCIDDCQIFVRPLLADCRL